MFFRFLPSLPLLLLTLACSSAPEVRYYQVIPEGVTRASTPTQMVLAVETLGASAAYEDERIIYRENPYRMDYYAYHRWSSTPSLMVSDVLRQTLEETGYFKTVLNGFNSTATAILQGRILAFEEVDATKEKWSARMVLDLQLLSAFDGKVVWNKLIERSVPVSDRTPEGVVRALSQGLGEVTMEIAAEIAAVRIEERVQESGRRDSLEDPQEHAHDSHPANARVTREEVQGSKNFVRGF